MVSPMQRSLAYLRELGWDVDVVERWIPGAGVRKDMYGLFDIIGMCETKRGQGEIAFIQTTTLPNVAARIRKITDSPHLPLIRKCGVLVFVHGWAKNGGRWDCRVEDLS